MKTKHTDYVYTYKWFAWRPVRTIYKKWVWLKTVNKTVDERPIVYQGLTELRWYDEIK